MILLILLKLASYNPGFGQMACWGRNSGYIIEKRAAVSRELITI
jgi:hypothetical protein